MDFLFELGRDLLFVSAVAACLEMILPESGVRRPLRFIFGLWFLALLLNPLVSLVGDGDFKATGSAFFESEDLFSATAASEETGRDSIRREAGERLSAEIKTKLEAVFEEEDIDVEAEIDESGIVSLYVTIESEAGEKEKEMRRFLVEQYGVAKENIEIMRKEGGGLEGSLDAYRRRG